ncbi:DUF4238 domain-containing protein [Leptospira meyeri]|uniref:DUF4238 domain-containing protein n=1 Tax=Leptospira meyeri TaxID=29508 RepID=UPI000566B0A1|nr:DUF4238 domain-containing protein [Leptospira meyeri]
MTISWRHHYLPEFYLKGFTDKSGSFFAYNKKRDIIESRKYFPKSIFFKEKLNTVFDDGKENDLIERLLSRLDSRFAPILKKIILSNGQPSLSSEEKIEFLVFLSLLIWRHPLNIERILSFFDNNEFSDLKFRITNAKTGRLVSNHLMKKMKEDILFKRAMAPVVAIQPFLNSSPDKLERIMEYSKFHFHPNVPAVLGDRPLLLEKNYNEIEIGEFPSLILPIASYITMINFENCNEKFIRKGFLYARDLEMFINADEFIICSDLIHLKKSVEVYRQFSANLVGSGIKNHLFWLLENPNLW